MLVHNLIKLRKIYQYLIWYGLLQDRPIDFINVFVREDSNIKEKLKNIIDGLGNEYLRDSTIKLAVKVIGNEIVAMLKELSLDVEKHSSIEVFKVTVDNKDITDIISIVIEESNIDKMVNVIKTNKPVKEYATQTLKYNLDHYVSKITNDNQVPALDLIAKLGNYDPKANEFKFDIKPFMDKRLKYVESWLSDTDDTLTINLEIDVPNIDYNFDLIKTIYNIPSHSISYEEAIINVMENMYKNAIVLKDIQKFIEDVTYFIEKSKKQSKDVVVDNIIKLVEDMRDGKLTMSEYTTGITKFITVASFCIQTSVLVMNKVKATKAKFEEIANITLIEYKLMNDILNKVSKFVKKDS